MKMKKMILSALICCTVVSAYAGTFTRGKWSVTTTTATATVYVACNGTNVVSDSKCSFNIAKDGTKYAMSSISSETSTPISDSFGNGIKVTLTGTASGASGVTVTQYFYLYDNLDYFLTDFTISSSSTLSPNYMAPIKSTVINTAAFSAYSSGNRVLIIPYHNTDFIRYISNNFASATAATTRSYEVGVAYNETSRQGIVAGSVEHTTWKTGVDFTTSNNNRIDVFEVYGGRAVEPTKNNATQNHGVVKGTTVKSPKMFVGYFSDWRDGLELYGAANAIVTPKPEWYGRKPFGWNSWGVLGKSVNLTNTTETANFLHDLQIANNPSATPPVGPFANDDTQYIGLDSYWNNMGINQLLTVPGRLSKNGQRAGIYMGGFITWNPDGTAKPGNSTYSWNDMALKYNNNYLLFDSNGKALDPTHPGVIAMLEDNINKFLIWGYRYIKIDFLAHAALEADKWYDSNITTGAMAYNYAMNHITTYLKNHPLYPKDDDVFVDLSIAPIFPSNYAHGRRISCDVYDGTMARIRYQLNSLTYGWWLDRAYHYNDGDMTILRGQKYADPAGYEPFTFGTTTLALSRSRVTSAVITGLFMSGDDLSLAGNATAKSHTQQLFTNAEVNEMARRCKSFRPVSSGAAGENYGNPSNCSDMYTTKLKDTNGNDIIYVAVFNFDGATANKSIDFARIGLSGNYTVKELWSGTTSTRNATWNESVSANDAKILKIYPTTSTGVLAALPVITRPAKPADPPVVIPPPTAAVSVPLTSAAPAPNWEAIKTTANGLSQAAYGRLIWGDYNNDGHLDALYFTDGRVELYKNNGNGTFTTMFVKTSLAPNTGLPTEIIPPKKRGSALFVDYNNDGNLDLVTVGLFGMGINALTHDGCILLYKNSGPPDYRFILDRENTNLLGGRTSNSSDETQGRALQAVDIDHDGWMDLIESMDLTDNRHNNSNWRLTAVYKNNNGIFERKTNLVNGAEFDQLGVGSIHVGDVNGDGYADIINVGWGDGGIGNAGRLYINNGNGTFTKSTYSSNLAGSTNCETILADINGDGFDDIIEVNSGTVNIHIGNGLGSFTKYTAAQTGLAGVQVPAISVGDVNNDGKLDILISGFTKSFIYYNKGTSPIPTFTSVVLPLPQTRGGGAYLIDINGDGNLDYSAFGYSDLAPAGWQNAFVLNKLGNGIAANTAPTVPANLDITYTGGKFQLSWSKSMDDKTPQNAIRYNVYAKNNDTGATYFYAPAHLTSGKLKVQDGIIPLISTNSFQWNLPTAKSYTFGVQAVDQANMASAFAPKNYPPNVGIATPSTNKFAVYSADKGIKIENENLTAGLNYSIYRIDGQMVTSGFCAGGSQEFIPVWSQGVYVVKLYQGGSSTTIKVTVL